MGEPMMKKLLSILLFVGMVWGGSAQAATYYVWANGGRSACGADDKTSALVNSQATALNMTGANACNGLSAGDVLKFSSAGGDFTTAYVVGNGGSDDNNRITATNVSGESPLITVGGATTCITNDRNWVTIDGINATQTGTGKAISVSGTGTKLRNIIAHGGTASHGILSTSSVIDLYNITATTAVNDAAYFAIIVNNATTTTADGITVSSPGISSGISFKSASLTASNLSVTGAKTGITVNLYTNYSVTGTNWSTINCTYYAGIYLAHVGNPTGLKVNLSGMTSTGTTGAGLRISGAGATYLTGNTLNNFTLSNNSTSGAIFSVISNFAISNGTANNNTAGGITLETSSNNIISGVTTSYNGVDGLSFLSGVTNTNVVYSTSNYNGQVDVSGNGDGFTSHTGCIGNMFAYDVAVGNKNSGHAHVNDSSGSIYNNTIYGNGDSTSINMGVRGGIDAGTPANWTLKNNLLMANYPYELYTGDVNVGATFNNNVYYHVGNNATEASFVYDGTNIKTWSTYHTTDGKETSSIYGDPLFYSATDFHLTPGSPAAGAGTFIPGVHDQPAPNNVDLGGQEFNSMAINLGAYGIKDSNGSVVTRPTLKGMMR